MWPGRVMSAGVEEVSARICTVRARSAAEMPVLTPDAASQETVYAVPLGSSLLVTMGGRFISSARLLLRGAQTTPEV